MTRSAYLQNLALVAVATLLLAIALYLFFGGRWFSFYGWAAAALFGTVALSRVLRARFTAQGLSRWPRLLFAVPGSLASLVQIGFWLAFFNGGPSANMLGPGRTLVLAEIGPWLVPALCVLLLVGTLLVARGLRAGVRTR